MNLFRLRRQAIRRNLKNWERFALKGLCFSFRLMPSGDGWTDQAVEPMEIAG